MNSVKRITDAGICSACGVCVGVCPKDAVSLELKDGTYSAAVNEDCIHCGICRNVCTALDTDVEQLYKKSGQAAPEDKLMGNIAECYTLSIKDKDMLRNSTSGGFVSGTVKYLLENKIYDCAFLVRGYSYDSVLKAQKVTEFTLDTAKSRYLSVSMEKLVKEMLNRKDERIIICAVGCAVSAIINVIDKYKLNRSNYLILGLFCDNAQSYRVNEYFKTLKKGKIRELYFRDKSSVSWPGNVKIVYESGQTKYFDARVRMDAKKYYKLKRCFLCFDKLNVFADISVGDNYTKENVVKDGSNSVIIRTAAGKTAFENVKHLFEAYETTAAKIAVSQSMEARKGNIANASVFSESAEVTVYTDLRCETTSYDKGIFEAGTAEILKPLNLIKKEIKGRQKQRIIKKIKRKLGIK